jgi:hypothetical protein
MSKRNREKLMEQSLYDLLCMMNANLRTFNWTCAMIGLIGYDKKVIRCYEYKFDCEKCLRSWMNEETPF